jgi:hemolysin activation/secretion protein
MLLAFIPGCITQALTEPASERLYNYEFSYTMGINYWTVVMILNGIFSFAYYL